MKVKLEYLFQVGLWQVIDLQTNKRIGSQYYSEQKAIEFCEKNNLQIIKW